MTKTKLCLLVTGIAAAVGAVVVKAATSSEIRWVKVVTQECLADSPGRRECKSGELKIGLKPDGSVIWK